MNYFICIKTQKVFSSNFLGLTRTRIENLGEFDSLFEAIERARDKGYLNTQAYKSFIFPYKGVVVDKNKKFYLIKGEKYYYVIKSGSKLKSKDIILWDSSWNYYDYNNPKNTNIILHWDNLSFNEGRKIIKKISD